MAGSTGPTTCRPRAARAATFSCSPETAARTGRASHTVARFLTAIRAATACTTSTASSASFARQESPVPNPRTCRGAMATSARSACPDVCPAFPGKLAAPAAQALAGRPLPRTRRELSARGTTPVVVGTAPERPLGGAILAGIRGGIDLTGHTDFAQITSLARAASLAVGNDTGPIHMVATVGCPSVVLFSRDSDPALCAPRGPHVSVLRCPDLDRLDVATVLHAVAEMARTPDDRAGRRLMGISLHSGCRRACRSVPRPSRTACRCRSATGRSWRSPLGLTLAVLDGAIANVALPTIARDLDASPAASIWVVNAYQTCGDDIAAAAGLAWRHLRLSPRLPVRPGRLHRRVAGLRSVELAAHADHAPASSRVLARPAS